MRPPQQAALVKARRYTALGLLAALLLAGSLAPWVAPYDPWTPVGSPFAPPGWPHLMGTNDLGQDLLSGVLHGLGPTLLVGLLAATLSIVLGTGVGLAAGYGGRAAEHALMGLTDTFMLIPGLPLMILLVAYVGSSLWVVVVIGLLWWTSTARAVRAAVLQVRSTAYIEAARATGLGPWRIVLGHVLPNIWPVVLARFIEAVSEAILTEAGLSFLGLGDPASKSLGLMLHHAFLGGGLFNGYWWWYTFPVLGLGLVVACVTLVGLSLEERREAGAGSMD